MQSLRPQYSVLTRSVQYTSIVIIVYFLRVYHNWVVDSDVHGCICPTRFLSGKFMANVLFAWHLGLCVTLFGHCLAVANRPPCQPPVTHIRSLLRRDSHTTFSLPYPFVSLSGHSAHYYESTSVSLFIISYHLLASLCSHGPQDRKRSNCS